MFVKSASFIAGARKGIGDWLMRTGKTVRGQTRRAAKTVEEAKPEKKPWLTFGKKLMLVGIGAPAVAAGIGAHAAGRQTAQLEGYRQAIPPSGMGPGY